MDTPIYDEVARQLSASATPPATAGELSTTGPAPDDPPVDSSGGPVPRSHAGGALNVSDQDPAGAG